MISFTNFFNDGSADGDSITIDQQGWGVTQFLVNVIPNDEQTLLIDDVEGNGIVEDVNAYGLGREFDKVTEHSRSHFYKLTSSKQSGWGSLLKLSFDEDFASYNIVSFWFYTPDSNIDHDLSIILFLGDGSKWELKEEFEEPSSQGYGYWTQVCPLPINNAGQVGLTLS